MMLRALGTGILWQKMTIREGNADKGLPSIRRKAAIEVRFPVEIL